MAIGLAFVLVSCGSPAGVPAPPVETPSPIVLKFVPYEDIAIDVSTIGAAAPAPTLAAKTVGAGGEYSDEIAAGPAVTKEVGGIFGMVLTVLSSIEMPVSESTTTFEGTVVNPDDATSHPVKIDFADFDFNGDGVKEGCSGHTAALPVCVRLWIDGARSTAWVFDAYPFPATAESAASPGKSRFRMINYENPGNLFPIGYVNQQEFIAGAFDYRDPEDVSLEMMKWLQEEDSEGVVNEGGTRIFITQTGPAATAIKTLNLHLRGQALQNGTVLIELYAKYLGRYQEGQDYWSGSIDANVVEGMANFENLCAVISTGNAAADQGICADLGISVAGIPYVEPAVQADVQLYDFPETPTF